MKGKQTLPNFEFSNRKIIHIDMDCFFAAVEAREKPELHSKPFAVGGDENARGVICTSNYVAREYGVRSAMATAYAKRLCPSLIVLNPDIEKYKKASREIFKIFSRFTTKIEPLSLDEAFLDVTCSQFYQGSATLIAKEIQRLIFDEQQLTASAGIASNKFLAKIASDWQKPNGLFVIHPDESFAFASNLPVNKIFGVGEVTAKKLAKMNVHHCRDLQLIPLEALIRDFGIFGIRLFELCRGVDRREVENELVRKSLSVEKTFARDLLPYNCEQAIYELFMELQNRLSHQQKDMPIKKQFLKIKFSNFKHTTIEVISQTISLSVFKDLFHKGIKRSTQFIRLLGLGVRFDDPFSDKQAQLDLDL